MGLGDIFQNIITLYLVFNCNTNWKNLKGVNQYIPEVYRRILKIWVNVSRTNKKQTLSNSAQVLWNNNKITYRNNCIFIPRWIKHDIIFVSDILTENGQISYNKVITKIQDTGITKFEFNCVKNALLKYENMSIEQEKNNDIFLFDENIHKLTNQTIRKQIQRKKYIEPENKWQLDFTNIQNLNLTEMWSIVPNCTKDSKLILLQWKILHKIYPTYKYLFKIKVKQSYLCSNCNKEDTLNIFFMNAIK